MAAPSEAPPLSPHHHIHYLASDLRGVQHHGDQTQAQNHDRHHFPFPVPPIASGHDLLPPPSPAAPNRGPSPQPVVMPPILPAALAPAPPIAVPANIDGTNHEHHISDDEGHTESDDGESGAEHDDSEDDHSAHPTRIRWQRIQEDKSSPCEDELKYIQGREEHSAVDEAYWQKQTFFDLNDPEITPIASGQIHWQIDNFNGTKEAPNKEAVMRSEIVRIGGYDWRIKFYPRGNRSEYLSVYLENVTMQDAGFEEFEDFSSMPFPVLAGQKKLRKLRSCAVQLSVVMYNPSEPRTNESQTDAHKFTKRSADYGWTRFTRFNRHDFFIRNHGQRQAILRDDKLAFVAYIRLIDDPTGCLWAHGDSPFHDSIDMTGLRPWSPQHPQFAAYIPLLHFAPFRDLIYRCSDATSIVGWLQMFLWKMLSRSRSDGYGIPTAEAVRSDAIHWLQRAAQLLRKESDAGIVDDLIGTFDGPAAAVGEHRLRTSSKSSIQAALDAHPTMLATPALLTLELERQQFDREKRRWIKLTNNVEIPNSISVRGKFYPTKYTLFAFITHLGALTSNRFNFHVRPNGPSGLWYAYTDNKVACQTHKQAVEKYSPGQDKDKEATDKSNGVSPNDWRSRHRAFSIVEDEEEVVQVVMYVRDDVAASAFGKPAEEKWEVPETAKVTQPPPKVEETSQVENGQPPDHPPSLVRCNTSATAAGHASPRVWLRDPEGDVLMSDAEDDEGDPNVHEPRSRFASQRSPPSPSSIPQVTRDIFGVDLYRGGYLHGAYHGAGDLIATNGNQYRGAFAHGQPHGHGTMIYAATGNTYTGAWAAGEHHGAGTLTEAATGNVFEGGWRHGRKHGAFVLRGTVTDDDQGVCSICYDRDLNTAFYDCGHVVACKPCAALLDSCPVCRKRVLGRVELFGVKVRVE